MQHSIPVSHSTVEFCGVQEQKVKLVFSESGVFHIIMAHCVLRSTRTKCSECP